MQNFTIRKIKDELNTYKAQQVCKGAAAGVMISRFVVDCEDPVNILLLEVEDECWLLAKAGVLDAIELQDALQFLAVRMGTGASKLRI